MPRSRARAVPSIDPRILWLGGALLLATLSAGAAFGQSAAPTGPQGSAGPPTNGVIEPPAQVDPGIKAKPPVPAAALPTPIVPPPGTAGGNQAVQPK